MPPEAQAHLLNAQRELLLAVAATIEHHRVRNQAAGGDGEGGSRARRTRPVRVELD